MIDPDLTAVLIQRTEAMRQEWLNYQIEHDGKDRSADALWGEIDCLVELDILKAKEGLGR